MVRVFKEKRRTNRTEETSKSLFLNIGRKKTSLNSVDKKYGMLRTTLQYWLHKDFPASGFRNNGRLKRVSTPDLEQQLGEHAVKLH
jgi:hypothetical protein